MGRVGERGVRLGKQKVRHQTELAQKPNRIPLEIPMKYISIPIGFPTNMWTDHSAFPSSGFDSRFKS